MFHPAIYSDYFTEIKNAETIIHDFPQKLDRVVSELAAFKEAHAAIKADPTKTEAARLISLDRLYTSRVAPAVTAAIESAKSLSDAPRAVDVAKATRLAPSKDPTDLILAGEVRAALARMEAEDRRAVVTQAIESGDSNVLSAIVSAPSFLSQIGKDEQYLIREEYISRHAPDLANLTEAARVVSARSGQTTAALEGVRSQFFSAGDEQAIISATAKAESAARHLGN